MKTTNTYIIPILCGLMYMAASCNKIETTEPENHIETGQEITLTALLPEEDPDTKVYITDDEEKRALNVEWNRAGAQKDHFSMISTKGVTTFYQTESGSDQFTGTLPEPDDGALLLKTYYAGYPANPAAYRDGVPSMLSYLYIQSGKLTNTDDCYMRGKYVYKPGHGTTTETSLEDETLNFTHMTAVLKPTFKKMTKDIEKIVIEIEGVNTNGWFNLKDGSVYGGDRNTIEIRYTQSDAYDKDRYIFLPPLPNGTKLTFTVCTADAGIYRGTITSKKEIQPGYLYTTDVNMTRISTRKWSNGIQPSASVSGKGTENDPYLIKDAYDLQWFLNQTITAGKYYKLVNDLVISSDGSGIYDQWEPRQVFEGTFDGNDNFIRGEMIMMPNSSQTQCCGFVGWNVGTIKNLHVDAYIAIENGQNACFLPQIGGIAGKNEGYIFDCTVSGQVGGAFAQYAGFIGGIAGNNSAGTIEKCRNSANIWGNEYNDTTSPAYIGGITGINSYSGSRSGYIKGCTNSGKVEGAINPSSGTCYVGGIVGRNQGTTSSVNCFITDVCINKGTVGIIGRGTNYYGGLAGYNEGSICTCNKDESSTGKAIGGGKAQSLNTFSGCGSH